MILPIAHDISDEQLRIAIASKEQLISFLKNSGRSFFVMKSEDLIRALPEPFGDVVTDGVFVQGSVSYVQNIVSVYRDYRRSFNKEEVLTLDELDDLLEWAHEQKKQRENAT